MTVPALSLPLQTSSISSNEHERTESPASTQPQTEPSALEKLIAETPRFKADAALKNLYANALSSAANTPPLFTRAITGIEPIPSDCTYGEWRQHLDTLVASDDFKQWADDNRIDLTKPVRIFPSRNSRPGFISATLKPTPSAPANISASNNPTSLLRTFGAGFGDGLSLPASWSLIMQAADTLSGGRTSVSVTPASQSSPDVHATRSAHIEEVAAFYGETIPDTQSALQQRATELKQADAFPHFDTPAMPDTFEMRGEVELEDQRYERGDIQNITLLSKSLDAALLSLGAEAATSYTDPTFLGVRPTPEQTVRQEKASIAATLENTELKIDPASWYFQDQQLTAESKVTLKQFIVDNGWFVPQTKDDISNLIQSLRRGPLPALLNGNLTGAMGWQAPLDQQEKRQLYSNVRYNNLNLPGLDAQTLLEIRGGAFTYLTKQRHWTRSELADPRNVIADILDSPKALALENALQKKMGAIESPNSRDWVMGAMVAGLDSDNTLMAPKRNQTARFNLADERFYGKPLSDIKQGLIDHLTESHRCTQEMAPVGAHLLLSSAAPELLVKDVPAEVTYGSPAWFLLKTTVALIEAKSPGISSSLSFPEVLKYAAIDPVSEEDAALLSEAKRETLIDWALVHGILPASPDATYSPEQLNKAQETFASVMESLRKVSNDLAAPLPMQKDMALAVLKEHFTNVSFERAILSNPSIREQNALDNGFLHVTLGPYSLLDVYINNPEENGWRSRENNQVMGSAPDYLDQLPDINNRHRIAVANYKQGREAGLVNRTKHLIAQLPLEDRKQLEYGKLDLYSEGTVIKHTSYIPNGTVNHDRKTPEQAQDRRSLIIKSTHGASVKFYEVCPQQNYIKHREDLGADFKSGPQGQWIKEDPGFLGGERYSNTAIEAFSLEEKDKSKLMATQPPHNTNPASYTSDRSQFLGELLSSHTLGPASLEELVAASRHITQFDKEDDEFEKNQELLLGSIPFVSLARNAIKGDWLAVASELIFDGVMYATTAGFGKTARSLKPLGSVANSVGKPVGKKLFEQVAASTSESVLNRLNTLRPGRTGSYNFPKTVRRPDIAEGTYKKGLTEISTPAGVDAKTGKYFAVDPVNQRLYGKSLDNFKPQVSNWVDDTLPGLPSTSNATKRTALDIGLRRDNVIQMGGPMRDLKLIGEEIHTFTDIYKSTERLNIVAHGIKRSWTDKLKGNGTKVYIDGTLYDAPGLVNFLKGKGVDPSSFDNVRLLVCYSADGRSKAFARLFQQEIKKPVKAFEGTVSMLHGSTEMTLRRNIVRDEVKITYPHATQSNVNLAADILVQDQFIGKITPHVYTVHGEKVLKKNAPPGSLANDQYIIVNYRKRHFKG
ncbi:MULTISPECIES: hypothetical protein [Pseudomonas]|uniref:Uncharacterized protein n=1 Tax=Pseudomonas reactans TaxID=117680 RepID=A0A7Y8G567_9PSED|nr:hypothetical protein [Pseudomonas reactans]NWE91447.1 hypothetical protein [Pseudomonas reactans]